MATNPLLPSRWRTRLGSGALYRDVSPTANHIAPVSFAHDFADPRVARPSRFA